METEAACRYNLLLASGPTRWLVCRKSAWVEIYRKSQRTRARSRPFTSSPWGVPRVSASYFVRNTCCVEHEKSASRYRQPCLRSLATPILRHLCSPRERPRTVPTTLRDGSRCTSSSTLIDNRISNFLPSIFLSFHAIFLEFVYFFLSNFIIYQSRKEKGRERAVIRKASNSKSGCLCINRMFESVCGGLSVDRSKADAGSRV